MHRIISRRNQAIIRDFCYHSSPVENNRKALPIKDSEKMTFKIKLRLCCKKVFVFCLFIDKFNIFAIECVSITKPC